MSRFYLPNKFTLAITLIIGWSNMQVGYAWFGCRGPARVATSTCGEVGKPWGPPGPGQPSRLSVCEKEWSTLSDVIIKKLKEDAEAKKAEIRAKFANDPAKRLALENSLAAATQKLNTTTKEDAIQACQKNEVKYWRRWALILSLSGLSCRDRDEENWMHLRQSVAANDWTAMEGSPAEDCTIDSSGIADIVLTYTSNSTNAAIQNESIISTLDSLNNDTTNGTSQSILGQNNYSFSNGATASGSDSMTVIGSAGATAGGGSSGSNSSGSNSNGNSSGNSSNSQGSVVDGPGSSGYAKTGASGNAGILTRKGGSSASQSSGSFGSSGGSGAGSSGSGSGSGLGSSLMSLFKGSPGSAEDGSRAGLGEPTMAANSDASQSYGKGNGSARGAGSSAPGGGDSFFGSWAMGSGQGLGDLQVAPEAQFGGDSRENSRDPASSSRALASDDPANYFDLISSDESLFKKVERRYGEKALTWHRSRANNQ
jgi:hypothetical protein